MAEKKPLGLYSGAISELQVDDFVSATLQYLALDSGVVLTIPAGFQKLVYGRYTIIGTLHLNGELVVL